MMFLKITKSDNPKSLIKYLSKFKPNTKMTMFFNEDRYEFDNVNTLIQDISRLRRHHDKIQWGETDIPNSIYITSN